MDDLINKEDSTINYYDDIIVYIFYTKKIKKNYKIIFYSNKNRGSESWQKEGNVKKGEK
jgi:hypothetical protein